MLDTPVKAVSSLRQHYALTALTSAQTSLWMHAARMLATSLHIYSRDRSFMLSAMLSAQYTDLGKVRYCYELCDVLGMSFCGLSLKIRSHSAHLQIDSCL